MLRGHAVTVPGRERALLYFVVPPWYNSPYLVESKDVLDEEAVCVVPREQYILEDIPHTFLLEAQVFCSYHRRIDQI